MAVSLWLNFKCKIHIPKCKHTHAHTHTLTQHTHTHTHTHTQYVVAGEKAPPAFSVGWIHWWVSGGVESDTHRLTVSEF